jgi:hypothetical protein
MNAKVQGPSAAPKTSPRTSAPQGPRRFDPADGVDQVGRGSTPIRLSPTAKNTAASANVPPRPTSPAIRPAAAVTAPMTAMLPRMPTAKLVEMSRARRPVGSSAPPFM